MSDCKLPSIDAAIFSIDTTTLCSLPLPEVTQPASAPPGSEAEQPMSETAGPVSEPLEEEGLAVWPSPEISIAESLQALDDDLVESEPAVPDEPVAAPAAETQPLKPVWEVDGFRWPALCDRLLQEEGDYFSHAGQKLCDASRQGLGVLAITSNSVGEGGTTLSISLARAAAAAGARVALLDGDLVNRQLAMGLGLDLAHGWLDVGAGIVPWMEAAVHSIGDGLTVFPARPLSDQTAPQVPGDVPGLLTEIAKHFDLLVIDLGILTQAALELIADESRTAVHAAIVVRDMRNTSEERTLELASQLRGIGVQAIGIAENYSSPSQSAKAA